jgi:uncharacterized protein (TIGR00106 family)
MGKQINMAVQILPWADGIHPYDVVDAAIEVIQKSGVKHKVCPFETVMEGEYTQLMKIVEEIHEACYKAGADKIICNIKIQSNKEGNVTIEDKMAKYE